MVELVGSVSIVGIQASKLANKIPRLCTRVIRRSRGQRSDEQLRRIKGQVSLQHFMRLDLESNTLESRWSLTKLHTCLQGNDSSFVTRTSPTNVTCENRGLRALFGTKELSDTLRCNKYSCSISYPTHAVRTFGTPFQSPFALCSQ